MSTTSEKLRGLVEFLYLKTEESKLDWNLSFDRQSVWSVIGDYRIEIAEDQAESFEKDIRVTVFNKDGDQVDTFTDTYFSGKMPAKAKFNTYYLLMSTNLETAKRQASGADAAIETILTSLGGSAIIEQPARGGFSDDLDDDVPF